MADIADNHNSNDVYKFENMVALQGFAEIIFIISTVMQALSTKHVCN